MNYKIFWLFFDKKIDSKILSYLFLKELIKLLLLREIANGINSLLFSNI